MNYNNKDYKMNKKGILLPKYIFSQSHTKIKLLRNINKYMDLFLKIVSIILIFSTIYGFLNVYKYLSDINLIFLLPDIITEPSTLISLILFPAIFYIVFFFICLLFFIIDMKFLQYINDNDKKELNHTIIINKRFFYFPIFISISISLILFSYLFDYYIYSITNDISNTLLLISNYIFIFIIAVRNYSSNISNKFWLKLFTFYTFFYSIFSFIWFFVAVKLSVLALNESYKWYSFIYISIFPFYISFLSCISFVKNMKNKRNEEAKKLFYYDLFLSIFISFMISFMVISFVFQNFINATQNSLYTVRFIEKPQDSSWYLIHNGNTVSETINGMNSGDIENKKRIFNNKDCKDDWCEDDVSMILEQRKNALYGYMAWNLGDTKVFCPASVDFFDGGDNNQEKSKKCLVIDGKYLQLVSEELLLKG